MAAQPLTDDEFEALKRDIARTKSVLARMETDLRFEQNRRFIEKSAYKVGDIVEPTHGFPARGRHCITRLRWSDGTGGRYFARKILKSGQLHKNEVELYWNFRKVGHRDLTVADTE